VRARLEQEAAGTGRLSPGTEAEQWCIVGEAAYVKDKIGEYRERLGVSHLIVTRLRLSGMDREAVQASVARVAEIVAG
jgi:alkanesulfonate monooxygenase SsuD/methylene tetrahydromethanopterin reductase-like flavin-dependent oxidoreductase (luciferase family)